MAHLNASSSLQDKAIQLERSLNIKHQRKKQKTHCNCFIASQCISAIIDLQLASNELQAIVFANELIESNLIQNVNESNTEHTFKNDDSMYQFTQFHHDHKSKTNAQRTPFYLVESDYDKCTIPNTAISQIKAIESVTKLEVFYNNQTPYDWTLFVFEQSMESNGHNLQKLAY